MRKVVASVALAIYLVILFDLTLFQFPQPGAPPNFVPFRSILFGFRWGGEMLVVNFLGNLAAFAPVGLLAPAFWPRTGLALRVAAASFGLSFLIEALQYRSGSRVADVDDLILNTLGGLIGYGAWLSMGRGMRTMGRWRGRPVSPREGMP